jgi:hypothetical protein
MAYGLELFNSSGVTTFSSTDITWNQVAAFQVNAGATSSTSYPALSGRTVEVVQMFINPPPTDRKALAHTISVSGTTVTVSGGNETVFILVLMQ